MKKGTKSTIILSSLAVIGVAGSLIAGSTYALFTSKNEVNIAVTSGKVDVEATIGDLVTYSGVKLTGNATTDKIEPTTTNGTFTNNGTAKIDDNNLVLDKVTSGDKVEFTITITNKSTVAVKYRTVVTCEKDNGLFPGLKFTVGDDEFDGLTHKSDWVSLSTSDSASVKVLNCSVILPSDAGNEYQETSCTISYTVEAVQGNASTTNKDANVVEVYTVSDLKWVQKNVTKLGTTKTVKLMNSLDLSGENWTPIGNSISTPFEATFDGNDKTISNLKTTKYSVQKQEGAGYGVGLFAYVKNATIKNLVIENADVGGETDDSGIAIYSEVGIVAGCSYGNSTFDKITIKDSKVKAQTKVGAILGQSITGGSQTKITNCTITNITVSGNYSFALVCGLINNAGSKIDMSGTTVDSDSKTEKWTSTSCTFDHKEGTYTDEQTGYIWEYDSNHMFIIEPKNAWTVQRGSGKTVTYANGLTAQILECYIWTNATTKVSFTD